MIIRVVVLLLVAGVVATTAGAAPPLARNGLLAFARMRGDNTLDPRIYVISARGSQRRQVSGQTAFGGPEWSPAGTRIAYPVEGGVVITRAEGRGRQRGFNVPGYADDCCDLDWSPDGKRIAVAAGPLYVKTLGGRLRKLTRGLAISPSWSPDGRLIAYRTLGQVFVIRADGRERRRLGRTSYANRELGTVDPPSWSPDGRKLVIDVDGALDVIDVRTRKKRRLVRKEEWNEDPLWSPSGRWIAFTRARASDKPGDVYLVRPDGSKLRRLTRTPQYEYSLAWSPNGRRLAYAGRRGDVFVVDVTTGRTRQISRTKCGERADRLAWSPRGDRFAFRSTPVRRDAEIVTATPDGTGVRPLTDDCDVWERNPAWSPRGDEIAYDRYIGRTRHLFVAGQGSQARRITNDPAGGADPSWSPDGQELVFSRSLAGYDVELFVIRRDGSGERRLTDTPGANYAPAWSPLGERIAFTSSRPEPGIYVMSRDGSGAVRLGDGSTPSWSPDASRIAFIRGYDVWTMKADGTDAVRLTTHDGYTAAHSPAWSPDGSQIAYSVDIDGGRGSQYALYLVDAATGAPRTRFHGGQDNLDPDWQRLP